MTNPATLQAYRYAVLDPSIVGFTSTRRVTFIAPLAELWVPSGTPGFCVRMWWDPVAQKYVWANPLAPVACTSAQLLLFEGRVTVEDDHPLDLGVLYRTRRDGVRHHLAYVERPRVGTWFRVPPHIDHGCLSCGRIHGSTMFHGGLHR
jgi:hypothetical protein